ncbi:50S ribosomal protein L10 [Candidatus Pacearchaeota archaeon CG10_big_fil_rev_8_21_14_0_10_31_24]|nr:MAG: 50S ribosomal protein L10 [Candidatus Pacearchaeota archaeon CG10_big_fil_rev_8_21_14_0_10_31_24]
MAAKVEFKREKDIPEHKVEFVKRVADKIKRSKTLLIASTNKLPSSQFHDIKKKLRGKADVLVGKRSLINRAIDTSKVEGISKLKESINADIAMFFSDLSPFELSGLLADNQSPSKAKAGDIAPEDIHVEPGPTDLVPGPAISELSGVGLKVAVEGGKLAVKQPAIIAKKGEVLKANVAGVMAKLGILPMKVGFEPLAAYSSEDHKVYVGIKIDKEATLQYLRESISKSKGFAISVKYVNSETIKYFIGKASLEEKALSAKIGITSEVVEEKKEETNDTNAKEDK